MDVYSTNYILQEIKLHKENHVAEECLNAQFRRDGTLSAIKLDQLQRLNEKNSTVECWLSLLSEDEEYVVIRRHLLDGLTWPQIEAEYAKKWKDFGKCQRTLMRYQSNALLKIQNFMNRQPSSEVTLNY